MPGPLGPPAEARLDEPILQPPWGAYGRTITLAGVTLVGRLVLHLMNGMEVRNWEAVKRHVMQREPGVGLITVSNHTSTLDDPFAVAALLPWSYFLSEHRHRGTRWSLCSKEICFWNPLLSQFFLNGKTLPIERGRGLDQPIMQTMAAALRRGDWLHVFPEGRVNYTGSLGAFKWGVGKLVCDSMADGGRPPTILPFYHAHMGRVMPAKARFPHAGNQVVITVGEAVNVSDLTPRCNCAGEDQATVWRDITARIREHLLALEQRSPANEDQRPSLQRQGFSEDGYRQKRQPDPDPDPAVPGSTD